MLLGKFKIIGHSMEPNFTNNCTVIISNITYIFRNPQIKDVVAFKFKNKIYIKRVQRVREDEFYLIGDNSNDSFDSRKIGYVSKDKILGKVLFKI